MQSSSSSQQSSPSQSQEDLPLNPRDIGLETLVEHFLAAKRSLLSATHVNRAQDIVASARAALEKNAVLNARNFYFRNGIENLIGSLEAVRLGCEKGEIEAAEEFHQTVQALDITDARLKSTLEQLRDTPVASAFRPEHEPRKFLFDFIDESGVNELYDSIKDSIDRYESARSSFQLTCDEFDAEIEQILSAMMISKEETQALLGIQGVIDTPIPALFGLLEEHASGTAQHLEGLTKHYDLCITALRHTEGGGEVITRASASNDVFVDHKPNPTDSEEGAPQTQPVGLGLAPDRSNSAFDENLQAISEEERLEMLAVLDKDASEVDEVVAEIRDTLFEMEDSLMQVVNFVDGLQEMANKQQRVLELVKVACTRLNGYISSTAEFKTTWQEEKLLLDSKREEVEASTDVFTGFIHAYDGLIVEVRRRSFMRSKMVKILKNALKEVNRLYQEDAEERENFRADQADYLPSDLWSGLLSAPTQYIFQPSSQDVPEILPEIDKSVYENAVKRIRSRSKT